MNNLDAAGIKESTMRTHYETFIVRARLDARLTVQTEQDFAEMAGAGLNWIRLPIGHWLVRRPLLVATDPLGRRLGR